MPSAKKEHNKTHDYEEAVMPDMIELWKKVYFQSEELTRNAVTEFLATQTYNDMARSWRSQYLAAYQAGQQNLEKILDMNLLPSKKDLAGIAEMIIALEDKIDQIDYQIQGNLVRITDSLIKITDFENKVQEHTLLVTKKLEEIDAAMKSPVSEPDTGAKGQIRPASTKKKGKTRDGEAD